MKFRLKRGVRQMIRLPSGVSLAFLGKQAQNVPDQNKADIELLRSLDYLEEVKDSMDIDTPAVKQSDKLVETEQAKVEPETEVTEPEVPEVPKESPSITTRTLGRAKAVADRIRGKKSL